ARSRLSTRCGGPTEAGTAGIISHKFMGHWRGVSIKTGCRLGSKREVAELPRKFRSYLNTRNFWGVYHIAASCQKRAFGWRLADLSFSTIPNPNFHQRFS